MMRDESEERLIHRLEAFSDIVIGFSLAQLGATLTIPHSGAELMSNPIWFFGFALAFAVVCSMWFFHHMLFSRIFVPKALPIVLNFVWLAVLALLIFATETYVHMPSDTIVMRLYFGCYALSYLILGLQYVVAMRYRPAGDEIGRLRGTRGASFMFLWSAPFLWCFLVAVFVPPSPVLAVLFSVPFAVAGFCSGMLGRRFRADERRLVETPAS